MESKGSCYDTYNGAYKQNKRLESLYAHLTALGYEMSTDERKLLDGTHEVYPGNECAGESQGAATEGGAAR